MSKTDISHYIISLGLTFIISLLIARFMIACNIVDQPNARSSHSTPMPRSGGVAIVVSFIIGLWIFGWRHPAPFWYFPAWRILGLGLCSIALLGFIDDLRSLKATTRFGLQLIICIMLIGLGAVSFSNFPFINEGWLGQGLGIFILLIWLLSYTNAFNFLQIQN